MERENEALDILFTRLSACKKYQGSYSQVVNKGRVAAKGESIPCCCCPCRPWQGPAILRNRNQVHLTCYQRKIKYPRPHFLFLFTFSLHKSCELHKHTLVNWDLWRCTSPAFIRRILDATNLRAFYGLKVSYIKSDRNILTASRSDLIFYENLTVLFQVIYGLLATISHIRP